MQLVNIFVKRNFYFHYGESLLSKRKSREATQFTVHRSSTLKQTASNTVDFNSYAKYKRSVNLIPKSLKQENYIELLQDDSKHIVFATGPAGSGKTLLAVMAAVKALKEGAVEKIILTRPAVGTDDEKHGFLPGDLNEKMAPWVKPIFDVMEEYYSPSDLLKMMENNTIEIAPIAFLRGRTFKKAFVICDEMQNSTVNSMKMVLTRIGEDSKMVITGDLEQHDRKYSSDNGLKDFLHKLEKSNNSMIGSVTFDNKDVQRHPVVKAVLKLYEE